MPLFAAQTDESSPEQPWEQPGTVALTHGTEPCETLGVLDLGAAHVALRDGCEGVAQQLETKPG